MGAVRPVPRFGEIHPSAYVDPQAHLADDVEVGPFCVIHAGVVLEPGVVVQESCVLGTLGPTADGELVVGADSLIRSHSVLYAGSTYGAGLRTGHHVTLREGITAGIDLQVGTMADFQGGCTFGDHVRTQSSVCMGQQAVIRDFVWIYPFSVITNDPHPPSNICEGVVIEEYAVLATHSVLLPGVRVGAGALVAAHSVVKSDVDPDTIVGGVPARVLGSTRDVMLKDGSGPAYPWRRHFHRNYPDDVLAGWREQSG